MFCSCGYQIYSGGDKKKLDKRALEWRGWEVVELLDASRLSFLFCQSLRYATSPFRGPVAEPIRFC